MSTIVVGIDETAEAENAFRFAHRLADRTQSDVVAIEAGPPASAERSPADLAVYEAGVRQRVDEWLRDRTLGPTSLEISDLSAETALASRASALQADFVVIGSQAHEGITPLGLGSLAHRLAHHLTCPLVVVPGPGARRTTNDVVIGIDGSRASKIALDLGAATAETLGGDAYAVHAINDIYATFGSGNYYGQEERAARREAESERRPIHFVERLGGSTEEILIDVVDQHNAALLVVAARERHSGGGVFLGKVPDHLLHEPPCPVMVLPHAYTEAIEREQERA